MLTTEELFQLMSSEVSVLSCLLCCYGCGDTEHGDSISWRMSQGGSAHFTTTGNHRGKKKGLHVPSDLLPPVGKELISELIHSEFSIPLSQSPFNSVYVQLGTKASTPKAISKYYKPPP